MLKRYSQFITEKKYIKNVDIEKAVKFLKERAPYFHKDYQVTNSKDFRYLMRGLHMDNVNVENIPFMITKPGSHTREALRPSDNIYNIIVDNLWEDVPNRSNSIFGRTESLYTSKSTYGYKFIVVPAGGSSIVVCPTEDFRGSFDYAITKLSDVFDCFEYMLGYSNKEKIDRNDWIQVSDLLEKINFDFIKEKYGEFEESVHVGNDDFGYDEMYANILSEIIHYWESSYETMFDYLRNELDFEENNFEMYDVENIEGNLFTEREFWTNGDCLLINPKNLDEIISRL